MRMTITQRIRASFPRLVRCSHLLLLSLALLTVTPAVQTGKEAKRATAERLLNEGKQLRKQNSEEAFRQAIRKFAAAQPLFHALKDSSQEAFTFLAIGFIYNQLDKLQKALDYYNKALPIYQAAEDRSGMAMTLNNMAVVYDQMGDRHKALDCYEQALPLRHAAGDQAGEALSLLNLGGFYNDLGERQKALDYLNQAVPLIQAVGDRSEEAKTLNDIGEIYRDMGERQKALDSFNRALRLRRAIGDRDGEAVTLNITGLVYGDLGEWQKALEYYNQALRLSRAVGNREEEATALNNIGGVYIDTGEWQKALDSLKRALPLLHASEDTEGEARTLNNIGWIYRVGGKRQKALDYYNQSLRLRRVVGDRGGEARTLDNIGFVYNESGETLKALEYYKRGLLLSRAIGNRPDEAASLILIAASERDMGKLNDALTHSEASIAILESLRTKIGSQELRSSYFATVQGYYELYIDLLMSLHKQQPEAGYDRKALQASERTRARSLLELLAESGADIRQGVDPQLLVRERTLQQKLNAVAQRQVQLLSGPHTKDQAVAITQEIEEITNDFRMTQAQLRTNSPRYAALTQPRPLTLREIQTQMLDADTMLLEYSLGVNRSYLWAVTPDSISSYELPKRSEIEAAAKSYYEQLSTATSVYAKADGRLPSASVDASQQEALETASRLSRMLLGPMAERLGRKRLVIVADGAVQYLPFAALPDPSQTNQGGAGARPLIEQHEIVSLPSISVLATLRNEVVKRKSVSKSLAVLADPVFYTDDDRVNKFSSGRRSTLGEVPGIGSVNLTAKVERAAREAEARRDGDRLIRLKGSREEAKGILALVSTDQAKRALDFDANRALVSGGELSQYHYVHFAAHGLLDSVRPELSAIVLSLVDKDGNPQDGYLRAHEIFNLNLPADMVVLSGCKTGLGKEIKGEGLVGLTRGFMYAGAARVVVSLWSVDDEATAELMVRFYRGILKEGKRPSDALRAAQLDILRQERWSAPHYWAAFTLQGEWR